MHSHMRNNSRKRKRMGMAWGTLRLTLHSHMRNNNSRKREKNGNDMGYLETHIA